MDKSDTLQVDFEPILLPFYRFSGEHMGEWQRTLKHQAGRHNQKRHGWRYGRQPFLRTNPTASNQTIAQRTRTGESLDVARRVVAARRSMRLTPESSERSEYRRRSDLKSNIPTYTAGTHPAHRAGQTPNKGIVPTSPRRRGQSSARDRQIAADAEARRVAREAEAAETARQRRNAATQERMRAQRLADEAARATSTSRARAASRPAPLSESERATRAAAKATEDAFSAKGINVNRARDLNDITRGTPFEGKPKDLAKYIDKAFNFKDNESGFSSKVDKVGYDNNAMNVEGTIFNSRGSSVGSFTRRIDLQNKSVYNAYMSITSNAQNTGFGSKFYRNAERAHIKAGIAKVSISANLSVGGYAWARMGFDFSSSSTKSTFVGNFQDVYRRAYGRPYRGKLNHAWEIATAVGPDGRKIGKDFMLGTHWGAVKDLTKGSVTRRVGEAYYRAKDATRTAGTRS